MFLNRINVLILKIKKILFNVFLSKIFFKKITVKMNWCDIESFFFFNGCERMDLFSNFTFLFYCGRIMGWHLISYKIGWHVV
jgi:hypothetical protein